jgi:hypothetical protein
MNAPTRYYNRYMRYMSLIDRLRMIVTGARSDRRSDAGERYNRYKLIGRAPALHGAGPSR